MDDDAEEDARANSTTRFNPTSEALAVLA